MLKQKKTGFDLANTKATYLLSSERRQNPISLQPGNVLPEIPIRAKFHPPCKIQDAKVPQGKEAQVTLFYSILHLLPREVRNPVFHCQWQEHTWNVSAGGCWYPSGILLAFLKLSSSVHAPTSDQGTQECAWAPRFGCSPWLYPASKPKGKQECPHSTSQGQWCQGGQ